MLKHYEKEYNNLHKIDLGSRSLILILEYINRLKYTTIFKLEQIKKGTRLIIFDLVIK